MCVHGHARHPGVAIAVNATAATVAPLLAHSRSVPRPPLIVFFKPRLLLTFRGALLPPLLPLQLLFALVWPLMLLPLVWLLPPALPLHLWLLQQPLHHVALHQPQQLLIHCAPT